MRRGFLAGIQGPFQGERWKEREREFKEMALKKLSPIGRKKKEGGGGERESEKERRMVRCKKETRGNCESLGDRKFKDRARRRKKRERKRADS